MALREGPHCEKECCTQLRPVGRALYDKLSRQVDWAEALPMPDERVSRAVRAVAAVESLLADRRLLCFSAVAIIEVAERGLLRHCSRCCRYEVSISSMLSVQSKVKLDPSAPKESCAGNLLRREAPRRKQDASCPLGVCFLFGGCLFLFVPPRLHVFDTTWRWLVTSNMELASGQRVGFLIERHIALGAIAASNAGGRPRYRRCRRIIATDT